MSETEKRVQPPEPRAIALERCMETIERELGPMSLYQSIAVQRALDDLAGDIQATVRWCDGW